MQIAFFAAFLVASHLLLMQVFRLTTYHRYFLPALPLLATYAALVGWALYAFDFHAFFVWQVVIASGWLFVIGRSQATQGRAMIAAAGADANAVRILSKSAQFTLQYYAYSACIYIAVMSATYLWLFNR